MRYNTDIFKKEREREYIHALLVAVLDGSIHTVPFGYDTTHMEIRIIEMIRVIRVKSHDYKHSYTGPGKQ